jgi:hypothetical protein
MVLHILAGGRCKQVRGCAASRANDCSIATCIGDPYHVCLLSLPAVLRASAADTMAAYKDGKLKEMLAGVGYSI